MRWLRTASKDPAETNTLLDPKHVIPVHSTLKNVGSSIKHTMPPYSIQVVEVSKKEGMFDNPSNGPAAGVARKAEDAKDKGNLAAFLRPFAFKALSKTLTATFR